MDPNDNEHFDLQKNIKKTVLNPNGTTKIEFPFDRTLSSESSRITIEYIRVISTDEN
jgi:hypothetical protein